jgi:hypothetical protein
MTSAAANSGVSAVAARTVSFAAGVVPERMRRKAITWRKTGDALTSLWKGSRWWIPAGRLRTECP